MPLICAFLRKTLLKEHWTWTGAEAPKSAAEAWFCISSPRAQRWQMECRWGRGEAGAEHTTRGEVYSLVSTSLRGRCPLPAAGLPFGGELAVDVIVTEGDREATLPLTFCAEDGIICA